MKQEYLGSFSDWNDVLVNFSIKGIPEPPLVFAAYDTPSYEGYANVVFKDENGWHHVSGSHCSCMGLEEQWDVSAFDPDAEKTAIAQGRTTVSFYGDNSLNEAWKKWIGENG